MIKSASILRIWIPVALFAVLWIDLVRQLVPHWESSEQYAYGWFVPFLALGLFGKRWFTRPPLTQASTPQPERPSTPRWVIVLSVLLFALLLPVRVIHEINSDWPTCSWLLALNVVGITLLTIFLMGGWAWVKHFAFPVCFILVAVAWPYRIEHGFTQRLMRLVANLTVEALGWFDIPAFQRGNLIEVNTGVVGIDEACSGIRSFQSTLMAGLFLGEFYLLNLRRRFMLLAGGLGLAFCFNVVRTFILTWKASSEGIASVDKWHDPAGLMIFFASFAGLYALAQLLKAKIPDPPPANLKSPASIPDLPTSIPRGYLTAVGCWAVVLIGFTEIWYRSHDIKSSGAFHWSASFPTNASGFTEMELNRRTRNLLRFDLSGTGKWKESDGTEWTGFFFRWNPTSLNSILLARQHRPEECLPAAGLRQVEDAGLDNFEVGSLKIPFRRYTYESSGGRVHVFFCQWEDGTEKQLGMWGSMKSDRVRAALIGRRNLGQQSLEMILAGYASLSEAEQAFRKRLPDLIRIDSPVANGG